MFIQTEDTPNPNTLKFLPGITVLEKGTLEFVSKKDAESSELASLLFEVKNVIRVLFGYDFVSVSKSDDGQWDVMKPHILTSIMEYFTVNNGDVISNLQEDRKDVEYDENDSEIVEQIQELIHSTIRPAIMQDGGDIEFKRYKDGIVFLQLKGSCSGCPSAAITLKEGIEDMLKHYVPEVKSVEDIK